MSIKDILVICDSGEANDYRVESALLLQEITITTSDMNIIIFFIFIFFLKLHLIYI